MTGRQLVKVPGTSASDSNLLVAATSPDRVRDPTTGRWSIDALHHRTASNFDRVTSLAVTATGEPLIAYTR